MGPETMESVMLVDDFTKPRGESRISADLPLQPETLVSDPFSQRDPFLMPERADLRNHEAPSKPHVRPLVQI